MEKNWRKNVAVFIGCQAISLFGSSLVQYAMTWHIVLTTRSGFYATIAIICGFLPTLLLSPFAGVWADRYNRKLLIIGSDGFIAFFTLVLALIYMSGFRAIWLLFVVMALRALGTAVQMPCIGAMLPDLVPTEHLMRVNGINSSMQSLIFLGSPLLAGILMGFCPLETIFFIDVITAALAIGLLLVFLYLPARPKGQPAKSNYLAELMQGFAYVGQQLYLRNFFLFCAVLFLLAAPPAFLTPLQVTRTFGGDVWRLTAIEMAFAGGMTVGGLLVAVLGGLKNRVHTMGIAFILLGVLNILLGLPGRFSLYLATMAAVGLTLPFFNTSSTVLLQEKVEPQYLGRVFGVMTMISSSMMPLGMLVFGPLADKVAIEWLLICTGVGNIAAALLLLRNRPLLEAGVTAASGESKVTTSVF
jgi:DHA3 family macrolide efflux protein-like MFS transporter